MKIGIINLGINNIKSVKDFFSLFGNTYILHHADDFKLDTKIIILPGNGSFGAGVENLKNKEFDALLNDLRKKEILIIGICLGMQLFFESSDENSRVKGLNFFDGKVKKIVSKNCRLPLLGWYEVSSIQKEINKKNFFFNNGYSCFSNNDKFVTSKIDLGDFELQSSIKNENVVGFQFHPEKSSSNGLQLIKKLLEETANV